MRRIKIGVATLFVATLSTTSLAAPPIRVAFAGQTRGGTWDIWLASSDGTVLRPAVRTPDVDERTPVISPDRKYVAFSTSRGDLQLYNLYDGLTQTLRLPSTGRPAWPAWGANDGSLYYVDVLMGKGPDEGRVWKYDPRTGRGEIVADEPEVEGWPALSPDGVLLFTNWTQSQTCHLSAMAPQGKQAKVTWDRSLSLSGASHMPSGRIAVIAGDQDGQKVLLMTQDGRLLREYPVAGASGRPVAYQEGVLLTRIEDGLASLHVLNISSGETQRWRGGGAQDLVQMRDPDYR